MLAGVEVEVEKERCETSAGDGRKQSCTHWPLQNMQTSTHAHTKNDTSEYNSNNNQHAIKENYQGLLLVQFKSDKESILKLCNGCVNGCQYDCALCWL